MTIELTDKERKTIILALSLYRSELKNDPRGLEMYAAALRYTMPELLTDYPTEILPLCGRLSRPDFLERKQAH